MQDGIVSNVPVGGIIQAPIGFTNEKFLPCDGRTISRASYSDLSAVIPTQTHEVENCLFDLSEFCRVNQQSTNAVQIRDIMELNGYYYIAYSITSGSNVSLYVAKVDFSFNIIRQRVLTTTYVATANDKTAPKLCHNGAGTIVITSIETGQSYHYSTDDLVTIGNGTGFATTAGLSNIVWNGSLFITWGTGTTAYTSADGITWTAQTLPGTPVTRMFVANNLFVFGVSTTQYYTSANGATGTWTLRSYPTTLASATSIFKLGNRLYMFSSIRYTIDGINWSGQLVALNGSSVIIAHRYGNRDFIATVHTPGAGYTNPIGVAINYLNDTIAYSGVFFVYDITPLQMGNRGIKGNTGELGDAINGFMIGATNLTTTTTDLSRTIFKGFRLIHGAIDYTNNILLPYRKNSYIKVKN